MERIRYLINQFLITTYRQFIRVVGFSGKNSSRGLFRLIQTAAYAILFVLIVDVLSLANINLGEFGDFFGGVLNPILTFLMLIGLIITIVIQRVELRLSRNEFRRTADALQEQTQTSKKQSFENTFFQMMKLYNEIMDSLSVKSEFVFNVNQEKEGKTLKGRDCIEHLYESWRHHHVKKILRGDHNCPLLEAIDIEYTEFYNEHGNLLGHYFRTIYNIVKLVDNSEITNSDKKNYTNILRSQLSKYELGLLLYNCLSHYGKERFLPLVNRYDLLKHVETGIFENPDHLNLVQ